MPRTPSSIRKPSITKAGWCLQKGIDHLCGANEEILKPLVVHHGPPTFYSCQANERLCRHHAPTQDLKDPKTCFQSLCRTIAGQFVSGHSAQAAWKRLLTVAEPDLTPERILTLVTEGNESVNESMIELNLQKPAGLTRSKARSIVDLAQHFSSGTLSEIFLTTSTEEDVRNALLKVRGVGPWSCDMFLMFYLERPNILPLSDLGVKKGIAKYFRMRGSGKNSSLCEKKDAAMIEKRLKEFQPYYSLLSYCMWRAADTPLPSSNEAAKSDETTKLLVSKTPPPSRKRSSPPSATPPARRLRPRTVTP